MAKKPQGYFNKSFFESDSQNNSSFDRGSFSSRCEERRRSNNGTVYFENMPAISRASSTESLLDDLSSHATTVFQSLDPNDRGFIKPEDLFLLNLDLKEDELMDVFNELDVDNDGCINLQDFKNGLKFINKTIYKKNVERRRSRVNSLSGGNPINEEKQTASNVLERGKVTPLERSLDEGISLFSCEERISDLYKTISSTSPEVAEQVNDLVDLMVRDIKDLMTDKYFLNVSFQKEKAAFENQIRQLEQEFDSQINYVCKTETKMEAEKIEKEFRQIMFKKDEEINSLKERLSTAEEISRSITTVTSHTSIELKEELSKLQKENNYLQVQLCSFQTECAMIRSEQVTGRQQVQERIAQLQQENEKINFYENDWQNLTKQLQMLRDINRRLQDTNDSLRSAVETSPFNCDIFRKITTNSTPSKSLSSINNNFLYCEPAYIQSERARSFRKRDSFIDEYSDSRLSTLRDVEDLQSEMQPLDTFINVQFNQSSYNDYQDYQTQAIEKTMVCGQSSFIRDFEKDIHSSNEKQRKHKNKERRKQQIFYQRDLREEDTSDFEYSIRKDVVKSVKTVMPDKVYTLVFGGDMSVGKSSLMMRICSDSFVSDYKSTIGIDYRTKTVVVDNKAIGLQLWDTGGHEKFRSMTVNYFRKADAVLLLYDCTCQKSFIHVRDWLETIRTSAGNDIPILLISNKSDLATKFKEEDHKIVSTELGVKLAKEANLIFIETSAKSGHNIQSTIEELVKLLDKNEDLWASKAEVSLRSTITPQSSKSSCCK